MIAFIGDRLDAIHVRRQKSYQSVGVVEKIRRHTRSQDCDRHIGQIVQRVSHYSP